MYQGLIFLEQDFLQYKLLPEIFKKGINPKPELGMFHSFDYFDMMILMDFMSFVSNLIFIFIYLVSSLYPTPNITRLMMLNTTETRSKDFLESQVYRRNLIIQLFSYFILSISFVYVCYIDANQKNLPI